MAETGDKITRRYDGFRGVDFRSNECALNRSPDALNVWRNYHELASIETRPALKHFCREPQNRVIDMEFIGDDLYYITAGGGVHKVSFNDDGSYKETTRSIIGWGASKVFEFDGAVYAIGRSFGIKALGSNGIKEYFVPTTSIGSLPNGDGRKTHQDVNMLTPKRINAFHVEEDTTTEYFRLDAEDVDKVMPIIKIDGKQIFDGRDPNGDPVENESGCLVWDFSESSLDPSDTREILLYYKLGRVQVIGQEFPAPYTEGYDNIEIIFSKTVKNAIGGDANKNKIAGCTIVQEFDNRIFLSGNPEYPNFVFHSSLNNPMYFSDLDVYEDGKGDGRIREIVAGNGALWVFRESNTGNGVYYHTAAFDSTYGKVYPSAHSNITKCCVGGAINFLDDVVFFSEQGMESVSQNIESEQFATHKSSAVDIKMVNKAGYKDMVLVEWQGYLLVCIGKDIFLADSRAMQTVENHYEYEWYHWTLGEYDVNCAAERDGILYIGTDGVNNPDNSNIPTGNIYTLKISDLVKDIYANGDEVEIKSYWTTPKDIFAAPNKVKTTNKKGFIVEAEGDITLSAKTEGGEFEVIGEYKGIKDHFVGRVKRKKFKDLQFKFESKTKFKLESATVECFVGGYIKR